MGLKRDLNVIYLSHQPYMVKVGIKMKERYGWNPVYWFTDEAIKKTVEEHFPKAITHHFIDAIKGIEPAKAAGIPKGVLDETLLNAMAVDESIALNMMERNDSSNSFTYRERLSLYHHHLEYWLGVCKALRPDLIIFEEEPHQATDYILYAVAKHLKIETVMFVRTSFMGRMFPIKQFEIGSPVIKAKYGENKQADNSDIELEEDIRTFIATLNSTYDQAIKVQLYDQIDKIDALKQKPNPVTLLAKKTVSYSGKLIRFPVTIFNLFHTDIYSDQKKKNQSFKQSSLNNLEVLMNNKRTYKKKLANKTYYESIQQSKPDLDQPYIFCALSYQPEKTTSPMGGHFVNQLLMVKMLRNAMPPYWKLYVKDHISQFSWYTGFGEQHRSPAYYDEIKSLPNTELVSLFHDTFTLIDKAKAVATVTGSVGFEAIIRSKPALIFGYPWYKECEGALYSGSAEQLAAHITRISDGYLPDSRNVSAFLKTIQEHSFHGVVGGKTIQKQAGEKGKDEPNSEAHIKAIEAILTVDE
jgi:hypothetical protein